MNMPTIAICDTDTPLRYIDVAIPANNKSVHSVGLIWWLLAREVLRLRGTLQRDAEWEVMPDLYVFPPPPGALARTHTLCGITACTVGHVSFDAPLLPPQLSAFRGHDALCFFPLLLMLLPGDCIGC